VALHRQRRRTASVLVSCAALAAASLAFAAAARSGESPDQLRARLSRLEARRDDAVLQLYAAQSALDRARSELADARSGLALAQRNDQRASDALARRLVELYMQGTTDPLEVLLGASSLSDAVDGIDLLRRTAARDAELVREVRGVRRTLGVRRTELAQRTDVLATRTQQQQQLLDDLRLQVHLTRARIHELELAAAAAERRAEAQQRLADQRRSRPTSGGGSSGTGDGGSGGNGGGGGDTGGGSPPPATGGSTLTVTATAYDDTGGTASGVPAGPGLCATDWSVIPSGTRFYVPGYGTCVAADTGGAIVGDRIDVWFPTAAQTDAWGVRTVTITLL
jgi:3D (Asp-Asp-Asp) domain-containing protein/septal ring factor EnvC (AmiA/AmiB activator)